LTYLMATLSRRKSAVLQNAVTPFLTHQRIYRTTVLSPTVPKSLASVWSFAQLESADPRSGTQRWNLIGLLGPFAQFRTQR
jgi:hypothetical protein